MEEMETLSFLEEAKNVLSKFNELKKEENVLLGKKTTYEKQKESVEKTRDEMIAKKTYDMKKELEKAHNEILLEANKRVDVAKKEKEDERKKNIQKLVEKNTKELTEKSKYLNTEVKKVIKENKLPFFANSEFFFVGWAGRNIFDTVKMIIATLVLIVGGCALIWFINYNSFVAKFGKLFIFIMILVWLLYILVIAGFWYFIETRLKNKDYAIDKLKELNKNIKDNKKELKNKIEDTRKNVKDEDFDYTKLDREIEAGEIELKNKTEKQKEDLEHFKNVTKAEIKETISKESEKTITSINEIVENTKIEIEKIQNEVKEVDEKITEYKNKLGNNITISIIDKMIEMAKADSSLSIEEIIKKVK